MDKPKLIRIVTVPMSLNKLLNGQWEYFKDHYSITAVSSNKKELEKFGEHFNTPYHEIPLTRKITPFQDLYCIFKLYRFLRKEKPKIVHTQTPKAGLIGMIAAFLARVPIRMHDVVGLPLMEKRGLKFYILYYVEKLTYACAHVIYPNSSGLKDYMLNINLISNGKAKVIGHGSSNGIDVSHFSKKHYSAASKKTFQKKWNLHPTDFVFLFVGRLVGDKGINELIHAFDKLSKQKSDIKLMLVGTYEEALDPLKQDTLEKIKTNPQIIYAAYQEDVRAFYANAACFVFPSYREGFPNVVLEATAMELPCIVTDINGSNEIIFNDYNGLVIPKKDPDKLQEAMHKVYTDETFRKSIVANARKGVEEKFDKKIFYSALLEEYKKREENV